MTDGACIYWHERQFLNYNNKGKGQLMMVFASANVSMLTEEEPNLDGWLNWFKIF